MTSAELARADQVRPQSMSTTVAGLRKLGFVESERGASDARRQELFLTELGRSSIERVWSLRDAWLQERIASTLGQEARADLGRGLTILRDLLEAADESADDGDSHVPAPPADPRSAFAAALKAAGDDQPQGSA